MILPNSCQVLSVARLKFIQPMMLESKEGSLMWSQSKRKGPKRLKRRKRRKMMGSGSWERKWGSSMWRS